MRWVFIVETWYDTRARLRRIRSGSLCPHLPRDVPRLRALLPRAEIVVVQGAHGEREVVGARLEDEGTEHAAGGAPARAEVLLGCGLPHGALRAV